MLLFLTAFLSSLCYKIFKRYWISQGRSFIFYCSSHWKLQSSLLSSQKNNPFRVIFKYLFSSSLLKRTIPFPELSSSTSIFYLSPLNLPHMVRTYIDLWLIALIAKANLGLVYNLAPLIPSIKTYDFASLKFYQNFFYLFIYRNSWISY